MSAGSQRRVARTLISWACVAVSFSATFRAAGYAAEADLSYRAVTLDLGSYVRHLHWGSRRGTGKLDLFVLSGNAVRIWWQGASGFGRRPTEALELPEAESIVDFGNLAGDAGEEVVVVTRRGVFVDRRHEGGASEPPADSSAKDAERITPDGAFRRWRLERSGAGGIGGPVVIPFEPTVAPILVDLLPPHTHPEVVVPRQRRYEIYSPRGDVLRGVAMLEASHRVVVDPGGDEILDPMQLEVDVRSLEFDDVNGDGRVDIVVADGDNRSFYLQSPQGFSSAPSFRFDMERLALGSSRRNRPQKPPSPGDIELNPALRPRFHAVDFDADGRQDYMIASGQVVQIYFGGAAGADFGRPHLARKLSGEVQGVGSFDVNSDGRLDVVVVKFDFPSVARILAAYFISMRLDFEVLAYFNRDGRRFSRRPDTKLVLTLKVPPLRSILENFDTFASEFLDAVSEQVKYAKGDVNADGLPDAVFVDPDGFVRVFLGRASDAERMADSHLLGDLFFRSDQRVWELEEFLAHVSGAARRVARERLSDRRPDVFLPIDRDFASHRRTALRLLDVNADGRLDVILWLRGTLKIFLSNGPQE